MSSRPLKRQRSFSPLTVDNKWKKILKKWTQLSELPTLFTDNGEKCIHFDVQLSFNTETVTVRQVHSNGLNSDIYMVDFWSGGVPKQQNVILKHNMDDTIATEIEAELQMWSFLNGGNAPKVYAYNHKAIISELCNMCIPEVTLPKGFVEPSRKMGKLDVKKKRWVGTYNIALGPSSLRVLDIAHSVYKESGLYNTDPNLDNYMLIRGREVQIDYGKEKFGSEKQFTRWYDSLPPKLQSEKLRVLLIEKDPPAYPPGFYWWKNFVYGGGSTEIQHGWEKYQWATYLKALENKRKVFIQHLQQQYSDIVKSSKYFARPSFVF